MPGIAEQSQEPFAVRALSPTFGAEIIGVDLSEPMPDAVFDRIYEAFLRISCCCFRASAWSPASRWRSPGASARSRSM
jgi:alpha-ketoglutarate-dependent taurine dioxygenase